MTGKPVKIITVIILSFLLQMSITENTQAATYHWAAGFDAGISMPTETFNEITDNDKVLGLNLEYMNYPFLGMRFSYRSENLKINPVVASGKLKIDSLSIAAVVAYSFPERLRLFVTAGPCYYGVKDHELLGFKSDSKDIGWCGGGGIDFYIVPRLGLRFQSLYNSAELTSDEPRMSWVDTTIGLTFRY